MRIQLLSLAIAGSAALSSVGAQAGIAPAIPTVAEPTAAATTQRVGPKVLASVTSKDKVVTGSLGTTFGMKKGVEINPWFAGSGPLDENDATSPVVLADLSGLRAASKASAGINYLHWTWTDGSPQMLEFCRRTFADSSTAPDSMKKLLAFAAAAANPARRVQLRDSLLSRFTNTQCGSENIPTSLRGEFLKRADFGTVWLAGISGEYGSAAFKYADTLAASYKKQVEQPYAASVGGGVYIPDARVLIASTLRVEHAFDGGTPRQYCIPTGTGGGIQCRTVTLGPPTKKDATLFSLETRWFLDDHYGVSPRLTINTSAANDIGIEVPILLRQDADEGFKSAIALGWKSKPSSPDSNDRFYVSLVIGITYGIGLKL